MSSLIPEIYVLWHPRCEPGDALATRIYGWLRPGEMADGLGLAETTPGPLILVTQFVGFLAAFRAPDPFSPWTAGLLGAALTTRAGGRRSSPAACPPGSRRPAAARRSCRARPAPGRPSRPRLRAATCRW